MWVRGTPTCATLVDVAPDQGSRMPLTAEGRVPPRKPNAGTTSAWVENRAGVKSLTAYMRTRRNHVRVSRIKSKEKHGHTVTCRRRVTRQLPVAKKAPV